MERNNRQIRTLTLQEANTRIMVQHLAEHQVQQLIEGNCHLARTICELLVDAIDYPLFHTREARCNRMCLTHRSLFVTPSLQHWLIMCIFVAQRVLVGNGLEYGLSPQFAAIIPELHVSMFQSHHCIIYMMHSTRLHPQRQRQRDGTPI